MTALAMPFAMPRGDAVRWGICFAVAIAAHGAVALALLLDRPAESEFGVDAPVVMLDLPESFAASALPPTDLAPGPKEEESEATPPPKEEAKPPETQAEVALPEPPKPEPPQVEKQATAPPASAPSAAVVHNWESLLVAHIDRFKRYPVEARERGEQGMVRVAFAIDRDGWVRSSRIVQSSGSSDLDQAALAMLARAQPMPRPPDRIPTRELSFLVPIKFTIR
jgi:periplasmic protein TonB